MSDYTKTTDFVAKDGANALVEGSLFDTEYAAIETAVATKLDKPTGATTGNLIVTSAGSVLTDADNPPAAFPNYGTVQTSPSSGFADSVALTGTVERIDITFKNLQCDDDGNGIGIMIGTGGSLAYTGYTYCIRGAGGKRDSTNGRSVPIDIPIPSPGGYILITSGSAVLRRVTGNLWYITMKSHGYRAGTIVWDTYTAIGWRELGGPLDIVGVGTYFYSNMTAGTWNVTHTRSA